MVYLAGSLGLSVSGTGVGDSRGGTGESHLMATSQICRKCEAINPTVVSNNPTAILKSFGLEISQKPYVNTDCPNPQIKE